MSLLLLFPAASDQQSPSVPVGGLTHPQRAVLTPRPPVAPSVTAYDAWLGPLRFVTVLGDITETLGESIETVGAALTAAERRPRPFKLTLPVRGDRSEGDPYTAGLRLRRQVRQLVENPAWRSMPMYFWFAPDPDLQGWLLLGGAELSYDSGGLVHAEFKLELTDCYLIGRPGQTRPARRLELTDHRGGTAPRDTRRTLYSTDRSSQALPTQPLAVPGDAVRLTGARRLPLDPQSTPGPQIAGRRLWRTAPAAHGTVVDYVPDPFLLDDPENALRDLETPGTVRVWDVTSGVPVAGGGTVQGDLEPAAGYGWVPVVGQPLDATNAGAMDNGWVRVLADLRSGVRLERMDLGTGRYRTVASLRVEEPVLNLSIVEATPERAVIAWRTANGELRAILQRGWDGPRLEAYRDSTVSGAPTMLFVPAGAFTRPAQTPSWVVSLSLSDARVLLAPVQADTTTADVTVDDQQAVRLSQPNRTVPAVLVCQVGLALGADALTANEVASRAICDARSVPTLVAAN